jgi:dockerin type I repeat protein
MVWDWVGTTAHPNPDEQYYVGMTTDQSGTPTFEYGTVATLSVVVVGVPEEHPLGTPDSANFDADGTITIFVDKSKVGNPQPGDLLGAVNGRTFNTGDTPPETLERSTAMVDHTFVKGNVDNSYPPATYTVVGNTICSAGNIEPVSAVSRKTHSNAGSFDIDLPLAGAPGIECRTGPTAGAHTVVVTFAVPVTVSNVTVTPGAGKTASLAASNGFTVNNSQVTVNLTNVSNAQTLTINLIGVTGGATSGNVAIPMAVLLGDVNSSRHVDAGDVGAVQRQNSQSATLSNFRTDVNASGHIDAGDVGIVQRQNSMGL